MLLPIDFPYPLFALVLFFNGISMGMFASPNRAAVMNSLPPGDRGAGGGMNQTFQNSAQVLSVGDLLHADDPRPREQPPAHAASGAAGARGPGARGQRAAHLPPVSILFAAFLGYNPIQHLVGAHVLGGLSAPTTATLTGRGFFPQLISGPFQHGPAPGVRVRDRRLPGRRGGVVLRGGRYQHSEASAGEPPASPATARVCARACSLGARSHRPG